MPLTYANSPSADCPFCRVVRGEESALVVCRTLNCLAFFPTTPATLGHTLVISKDHIRDLWMTPREIEADLMRMVIRVGHALKEVLGPDGMNLISSAGQAAEQTVFHLHLHVVPRWIDDPIGRIWPPKEPWNEAVKEDVAEAVRRACEPGS